MDFEPFGEAFLADPYAAFARHRRDHPVFYAEAIDYWVISRYEDCRRALSDFETFSASNTLSSVTPPSRAAAKLLADGGFRPVPTITNVDPPAHNRTRPIAQMAFIPRRVAAMEAFVRRLVRDYLDDHLRSGRSDIVAELTWELPALVLFEILGLPAADVGLIKEGGKSRLLFMFGRASEDEQLAIAESNLRFWRYCEALAEDRRAHRRDDFSSDLVHALDESGKPLSQAEVSTMLFGLLLAGHETTTNLLGNGLFRLLEDRARWEAIRADPGLIPNAVEEILRYDSSVIHWRRRTRVPVELSGTKIPAEANVLVALGAANRDPSVFPDPDVFDLRRENARKHLSFGFGRHLCAGAPLARLEARVVFEELTRLRPDLRLVPDQLLEYMPILAFRGPKQLWVETTGPEGER